MGETLKNSQKFFTIGFFAAQKWASSFTSFRTGGGDTRPGQPSAGDRYFFFFLAEDSVAQCRAWSLFLGGGGVLRPGPLLQKINISSFLD